MSFSRQDPFLARPVFAEFNNTEVRKTGIGPVRSEMYGKGLRDLCNKTNGNLNRLSLEMRKMDPCLEYGMAHWHPNKRPKSGL